MFIEENEKRSKEKVLSQLLSKLEEMDGEKIGKKPVMAEMSVTSLDSKPLDEESDDMEVESEGMDSMDKELLMKLAAKYLG